MHLEQEAGEMECRCEYRTDELRSWRAMSPGAGRRACLHCTMCYTAALKGEEKSPIWESVEAGLELERPERGLPGRYFGSPGLHPQRPRPG